MDLPGLDSWTLEYNSRPPKTWELCFPNHRVKNTASSLPCLGRRIINRETQWNDTFTFGGEFHDIPGYWEWAEDILSRSCQTLKDAKIYDVVYGSLFTYDRNTNILQAFCEAHFSWRDIDITLGFICNWWSTHNRKSFQMLQNLQAYLTRERGFSHYLVSIYLMLFVSYE